MNLNRDLQRHVLTKLKEFYPEELEIEHLGLDYEKQELQGNLFYLKEHELIESNTIATYLGGVPMDMLSARISAKGLDFLEDDGGISAILNAITMKFDVENIRKIFQDKIVTSALSQDEKKTLTEKIKNMSGEAMKNVIIDLLTKGLKNPSILVFIADILSRYV